MQLESLKVQDINGFIHSAKVISEVIKMVFSQIMVVPSVTYFLLTSLTTVFIYSTVRMEANVYLFAFLRQVLCMPFMCVIAFYSHSNLMTRASFLLLHR